MSVDTPFTHPKITLPGLAIEACKGRIRDHLSGPPENARIQVLSDTLQTPEFAHIKGCGYEGEISQPHQIFPHIILRFFYW
jgi:hypothetical protein